MKLCLLARNRDVVDQFSISNKHILSGTKEEFEKQISKQLKDEIKQGRYKTLLLSNEHLSSKLSECTEIARLKKFINKFSKKIKIIAYLRPQPSFYSSHRSTEVKAGAILENFPQNPADLEPLFNYEQILDRWADVFGKNNILVRRFRKDLIHQNDAVLDFLNHAGISNLNLGLDTKLNPAFGHKKISYLSELNKYIPKHNNVGKNPFRSHLNKLISMIDMNDSNCSTNLAKEISAYYADSNAAVAEKYLNGSPLFPPEDEGAVEQKQSLPLTEDDIFKISSEIIIGLQTKSMIRESKLILKSNLDEISTQIEKIKTALQFNPESWELHSHLGTLYFRGKLYDKAIFHLEKALELNPECPVSAYIQLSNSYDHTNAVSSAIKVLRRALSVNDSNPLVYSKLSILLNQQGHKKESKEMFAIAKKIQNKTHKLF